MIILCSGVPKWYLFTLAKIDVTKNCNLQIRNVFVTDYGDRMAKSLILCGSNPNSNIYLGFGYKGLGLCENNG